MTYEEYSQFRDMKGMKDSDVAKKAGIGASTFSDWKSGRSLPKETKLRKIAEALGLSIEQFMGWDIDVPEESKKWLPGLAQIDLELANDLSVSIEIKRITDKYKKLTEEQQIAIENIMDQFLKGKEG